MNIKKNIAVTILTTSFLISGISNPIGYNVSARIVDKRQIS
jgi:hypothetical protein